MDAEYLKEKARMTKKCTIKCTECLLDMAHNRKRMGCKIFEVRYPEKAVAIVEKWSKEHPVKTRQDEFLERFPNARKDDNGVIMTCPYYIGVINDCGVDCSNCWECREKYWLEEVEE